jgi:nucleotidyltransferase substrate binding protein (TIGR01987 family)
MTSESPDIRWKQRFQNYQRAYHLLERTLSMPSLSEVERAGLIQFFEMAFELAWKLMSDYLREEGFVIDSPKQAIKQAFQSNLIRDGHGWLNALNDRNLTVHTYDEATAIKVEQTIKQDYFPLLQELYACFQEKM